MLPLEEYVRILDDAVLEHFGVLVNGQEGDQRPSVHWRPPPFGIQTES